MKEQRAIFADLRKDHQLVRIVSELLNMAQAESGNIKLQRGEPRLTGIVSNAMEAVKAGAQQKRIRFEVRIENDDQQVRADGDQAGWVLVNLLSNAIRHSPADGVVIIALCPKDGWQEVTAADQGPGIPAYQQQRMIHRFAKGATVSQGTRPRALHRTGVHARHGRFDQS